MSRIIFPNIAVSDLEKAKAFYTALGFPINEDFTDENAACAVVDDNIFLMLLSPSFASEHELFPHTATPSMSLAFSAENRTEVDTLFTNAITAGAQPRRDTIDLGFMYSRGVSDPDGHQLDFVWMDMSESPD
ncbi:MAG: VOC family protein [Rhodoglobus sp.]|uniref:VOC family protein n=1 Tax=uncultured Salinibacterium sp. TaxID=459274 RepID=UPI0030D7608A|tara:strand:+ start:1836 stop:2231 length:396 start_codon:yes stop_codon:yes gene_type:complete